MHCIMKVSVIISVVLVAQVSASFFDVFQGAVLSVQNSFGKLLSDVVTDVKVTVDCTILAVEHVLSLSDDATDRYYEKCQGKEGPEPNTALNYEGQSTTTTVPTKLEISVDISNEDLKKNLPAEIDARVNETLTKILDDYNIKSKLESVEGVLAKETERLADVSDLVKEELDKLSSEVNSDIRRIEQNVSPPPTIETVLDKIKILQNMEQNDKNSSEAKEIHRVVDKVLDKLDDIGATEASENAKLEEILKDMESHSNNSFSDLEKQFDEWKEEKSKYVDDIKDKMEEEKEIAKHLTLEDASNRLFEDTSNSTIQAQSNNTIYTIKDPEIIPSKYEYSENATDHLLHVTDTISTGLPSTNKPVNLLPTTTYVPNTLSNNTEIIVNASNSINQSFIEKTGHLVGMQSSFISSNLSTSTDNNNLITSTNPEIVITTDSTFMSQDMIFDQPKPNSTTIDDSTTLRITDHFSETTKSETISPNIISNYSDEAKPINSADIVHYTKSNMIDSTIETISTNIFLNKSQPIAVSDIAHYNESALMDSTSETISTNIFSNYTNEALTKNPADTENYNESTVMDSTITTYEPFIPQTVLDTYYEKDEKSSDENKTIDLDKLITANKSAIVPTVIHGDFKTTIKPSYNLNSSHIVAVRPLIDEGTKSIASNLGMSKTSSIMNEESDVNTTASSDDTIVSTTEANKQSIVLTTKKPTHDNDEKVNISEKTSLDYDVFFNSNTKNSPIHKKAVKDAFNIIENSKNTEFIMNSILKHKKAGISIFNYPANFGK